jgi:hypothetical protein
VLDRGGFVLASVIEMDRRLFRQFGTEFGERFDILAVPSATSGAAIKKMPPKVNSGGSSARVRIKIVPPIEWPMRMAPSSSPANYRVSVAFQAAYCGSASWGIRG